MLEVWVFQNPISILLLRTHSYTTQSARPATQFALLHVWNETVSGSEKDF